MENENTVQVVTIPIETECDPSTLLDIIIEMRDEIVDRIEQTGEFASILEEEISVEDGDVLKGGE